MTDEDYTVNLNAETAGYQKEMSQSVSITDTLVASLGRVADGMANLTKQADRKLKLISGAEAAGITAVTIAAGRLEHQMAQLQARQVLLGKSTGMYTNDVVRLRREFGMASNDAIALITQLNKVGASQGQVENQVAQYAKLSAVTGESIQGLATANQQFMRTMDAAPRNTDKYASMVANLGEKMGTSAQSTLDFANNIAPLSKTMGMNAQEIAGISAAFAKSGQDGNAAANAYTKILSDINDAVQSGSPQISIYSNLLGKTVEEFKAMPAADKMNDIFKEIKRQGPDAIRTLNTLGLDGVRTQKSINGLMQGGGLGEGITTANGGFSNTTGFSAASDKALKGLNENIGKISQNFKVFGEAIGGVFLPAAERLSAGLNAILSPMVHLANFFNELPTWAKYIGAFAGALMVLAPLLPKLLMGLTGLGVASQLTSGPLARGIGFGRSPGQPLSRGAQHFVGGGGNVVQRGLFAAGTRIGDVMNYRGTRGSLGAVRFTDAVTGSERQRMGIADRVRVQQERMGIRSPNFGVPGGQIGPAAPSLKGYGVAGGQIGPAAPAWHLRDTVRESGISATRWLGQFARSGLAPMQIGYQRDPLGYNRYALTQAQRLQDTKLGKDVAALPARYMPGFFAAQRALPGGIPGAPKIVDATRQPAVAAAMATAVRPPETKPPEPRRSSGETSAKPQGALGRVFGADRGVAVPDQTAAPRRSAGFVPSPLLSQEGHDQARAQFSRGLTDLGRVMRGQGPIMDAYGQMMRRSTTVGNELFRQLALTARSGVGALAGTAYGAGRLGWQGVKAAGGIGRSIYGALGGIGGVAVTAGIQGAMHLVQMHQEDKRQNSALDGVDLSLNAPGAEYRASLGLAATATRSFADAVKSNANDMKTNSQGFASVVAALNITAKDVQVAGSDPAKLTDKRIGTMDKAQATTYAGNVLRTATPEMAAELKLDMLNRFGRKDAGEILAAGTKQQGIGDAMGLVERQKSKYWGFGAGDAKMSDENKERVGLLAGTLAAANADAFITGGESGEARQKLTSMNAFFTATRESAHEAYADKPWWRPEVLSGPVNNSGQRADRQWSLEGMGKGSQATKGRYEALMPQFGVDSTDTASKKAIQTMLDKLENWQVTNKDASKEEYDKKVQELETTELANTRVGAEVARNRALAGGPVFGDEYSFEALKADPLKAFGPMKDLMQQSTIGRMSTRFNNAPQMGRGGTDAGQSERTPGAGGMVGTAESMTNFLISPTDNSARVATRDMIAGANINNKGNVDKSIDDIYRFGNAMGTTVNGLDQLTAATAQAAEAQRAFKNDMAGKSTIGDRMGVALGDVQAARQRAVDNPGAEGVEKTYEEKKAAYEALQGEALQWQRGLVAQYRNLDIRRTQGEAEMNRQQGRAREEMAISEADSLQDFQISRARGEAAFNLSRNQQQQDYHRNRQRDEKDHNLSLVRMAEDSARSVYDIYSRVTVQRSWDAANLLQNMADQQSKIEQQQSNLQKIKGAGLSQGSIDQLGLSSADKAQQLERLLADLQNDPSLIAQYNKMAADRQKAAGGLAKEDPGFKRSEADRKKALTRQDEDNTRGMKRSAKAFNLSMSQSVEDFERLKERQRRNMERGFQNMRKDFDHQMDIEEKNISLFGAQITDSLVDTQKKLGKRASGLLKAQITTMKTLSTAYETSITDIDARVGGLFRKYDIYDVLKGAIVNDGTKRLPTDAQGDKIGGPHSAADVQMAENLGGGTNGGGTPPRGPHGGAPNQVVQSSGGENSGGGGNNAWSKHWPISSPHAIGTRYGVKGSMWASGAHTGQDFEKGAGSSIYAVGPGTVTGSTSAGGAYGNFTKIRHPGGVESWYAHQSKRLVKTGDTVSGGQHIGNVGATGNVTGPHLHLEIRTNGKRIDPLAWLNKSGAVDGGSSGQVGDGSGGHWDTPPMPQPGIKDLAEIKAFDNLLANFGYAKKSKLKPGLLGAEITNVFEKAWRKKNPKVWVPDPTNFDPGTGNSDAGGATGSRGVWNALRSSGLTEKQAGGVMGNIAHESNFRWNVVQGGKISSNPNVHTGYGLVQWTPGTKLGEILKKGGKSNNLENQIWALFQQLGGKSPHAEGNAGKMLRAAKSVMEATRAFMLGYERPANQTDANVRLRNISSEQWYRKYAGTQTPSGTDGGTKVYGKGRAGARKAGLALGATSVGTYPGHQPSMNKAWDMMINSKAVGQRIADHLAGHRKNYDILYEIWNRQILRDYDKPGIKAGTWGKYFDGNSSDPNRAHTNHVHSSYYAGGTNSARPGWALIGEHAPEWVFMKGGEKIRNGAQTAVINSKVGQTVTPQRSEANVTNQSFDHSNNFTGPITVQADDPNKMQRALEQKARLASLTKPVGSIK